MYNKSDLINLTEKIYELSTLADNIGFRLDNEIEQLLSIVQDEIIELEEDDYEDA